MEHVDFDRWKEQFTYQKPIYYVQFDHSGNVLGLYPFYEKKELSEYLEIDDETAAQIQEGKISLVSCEVDILTKTFNIRTTRRQDHFEHTGPLHRIIEQKYSEDKNYDVFITYKNKKLKFELAKKLGGTKSTIENNTKKLLWAKDKTIKFFVTDYNDPHVVYKTISCKIFDLIGQSVEIDISDCPIDFSVYTRKIFSNYVIAKI